MTPEEFCTDKPLGYQLFSVIRREVDALGDASLRVTKSQIAFRRERNFAWVWIPGQYLKGKTAPPVWIS